MKYSIVCNFVSKIPTTLIILYLQSPTPTLSLLPEFNTYHHDHMLKSICTILNISYEAFKIKASIEDDATLDNA